MQIQSYLKQQGLQQKRIESIMPFLTNRVYQQGDYLLKMDEKTSTICFIESGIVRGFYLDEEGRDVTKCFSGEGDWCCIYNLISKEPSAYYIEALEECQTVQIAVSSMVQLLDTSPDIARLYRKLSERALILNDERGISFQKLQAADRYLVFLQRYPELAERVKQEYIASYLGITPSSLSRIKRGL